MFFKFRVGFRVIKVYFVVVRSDGFDHLFPWGFWRALLDAHDSELLPLLLVALGELR